MKLSVFVALLGAIFVMACAESVTANLFRRQQHQQQQKPKASKSHLAERPHPHPDKPNKGLVDGMTTHDLRVAGHLASYIWGSILKLHSRMDAVEVLRAVEEGHHTLADAAREIGLVHILRGGRNRKVGGEFGEVGLLEYDMLPPKIAREIFDVRAPIADRLLTKGIIGPVCTEDESLCVLAAVRYRYRRSYFGHAWWDLERWCYHNGLASLDDRVNILESDKELMKYLPKVFPDATPEQLEQKRHVIREEFSALGKKIDPSTIPPKAGTGKLARDVHHARLDKRQKLMKRVDPELLKKHPEIYGMSEEELLNHGFHPHTAAIERSKAHQLKLLTEERRVSEELAASRSQKMQDEWGASKSQQVAKDDAGRRERSPSASASQAGGPGQDGGAPFSASQSH